MGFVAVVAFVALIADVSVITFISLIKFYFRAYGCLKNLMEQYKDISR